MLKTQYAILCEWVRQSASGTTDLLGAFDRIIAPRVPAQHPHLVFSVQIVGDAESDLGTKQVVHRLVSPAGRPVIEQRAAVQLRPGGGSWLVAHRMDFEVQGLILPEYGKYWFRLELDGKEIATHPLSVVKDAVPTR